MEKNAFELGLIAATDGDFEAINPFPVSSEEWRDWYDGFKCVCDADVQARRDLQRLCLTPSVGIFICALAALIEIVSTSEQLGLLRLLPEGFAPWGTAISAALIAVAFALAATLRNWVDVAFIAVVLVPVPFVAWFYPSAAQHVWFRYVIGRAFIVAPLIACLILVSEVKRRYRVSAATAARRVRTRKCGVQRP